MEAKIVSRLTGIPERKLEQIKSIPRPKHGPYTPKIVRNLNGMNYFMGVVYGVGGTLASFALLPYAEALTIIALFLMVTGVMALFSFWKAKRAQYKEHYKMYLMLKEEAV